MRKLVLMLIIFAALCSCTSNNQPEIPSTEIHTRCFNGVLYYFDTIAAVPGYWGYGFMAPVYNTKGEIVLCDERSTYDQRTNRK